MKPLIIMSILAILLISTHCENFPESVYRIRIDNKSTQTITVFANYILPDTALPQQKPEIKTIPPGEFKDIYDNEVGDEEFSRLDHDKLTVFVLSTDTIEKYPWATIKADYMILKRIEILESDLTGDGSISYP